MMKPNAFCEPQADVQAHLREWFNNSPGQILLAQERACLERVLPELFGYYLLQLGQIEAGAPLAAPSRARTKVLLDLTAEPGLGVLFARGDAAQLPVASDSVDIVLMPHTLDFSRDPHRVLREVERVLIPEGRVIILGFNPWSLWGLWRLPRYRSGRIPWCGQFLSPRRVHDWLSLLGFDLERMQFLMHRPSLKRAGLMQRLEFLERIGQRYWAPLGGVYLVQGVKRVSTLTPIRPAWKARPRMLGGRVAEPTTRNKHG
jgi:SAM-dependent methyltransferase